ncbi:MAG: 50S ribosomal protein L18 [Hyphomicrobiales bacterium]|nr:50S ribosomal protein L18 [Hyphomicrobiales bacterium]
METAFGRRARRVRHRIRQQASGRVRLSVHRTNKHIAVQLIDDSKGVTLAAASTLDKEVRGKVKSTSNVDAAKEVGKLIAKRARDAKVSNVVFDRGGFLYHGRVKALADAARESGLQF